MNMISRAELRSPNVVFAYMPWATTTRPSLALGILTSLCQEQQVPVRTLYANLDMSGMIGFEAAGRMSNERCLYGLSEHLFACDMFGADMLSSDTYLQALAELALPDKFKDLDYLRHLRDEIVPAFLDALQARIVAARPTALGLSSTFNQVMGSLAIAARVKRVMPGVTVLAGGACFDDEMGQEYHRAMPGVLDHVFMGEAEAGFREFLSRHKKGESTRGIPGVTWWEEGEVRLIQGGPLADLNDSPAPDYDDFFVERERVREATGKVFNIEFIPFEGARGCWWGQKNHCVFCGINPSLMGFREKPVERVISEIVGLAQRYRVVNLTASDYIVSRKHRRELFARLAELDLDIECFYEVRADLKKDEIREMRNAGVVKVQPGIESFSTELLRLMKKGTSRIRHVQFLRWAKEYGIHLSYNVLNGFPGEKAEWYADMAAFLPQIRHLQPPLHNVHRVEMHRFSPLFRSRDELGVDDYQLRQDYCFNFPDGFIDPLKIGYFFSFSAGTVLDPDHYVGSLKATLSDWIDAHKTMSPPQFHYMIAPGFTRVVDNRGLADRYVDLAGLHQDVFLLCDEIMTIERLEHDLAPLYPNEVASGAVKACVAEMVSSGLLMQEENSVLMLPIARHTRLVDELRAFVLGDSAPAQAAAE
ncbi:RiPP maturation radical SAM C-methyltransferase [Bradyrhizobium sp. HKCCYLS20291]|uniref:RiPP maturation radical SAM C-methyltransferase n=1 Tax=Bradyrhizobium sp. HKCCYLS20291 TaxID=3420766 RepID=UPI003EBCC876